MSKNLVALITISLGVIRSYLNKPLAKDDERVWINSIGEGAIIVSNYRDRFI